MKIIDWVNREQRLVLTVVQDRVLLTERMHYCILSDAVMLQPCVNYFQVDPETYFARVYILGECIFFQPWLNSQGLQ